MQQEFQKMINLSKNKKDEALRLKEEGGMRAADLLYKAAATYQQAGEFSKKTIIDIVLGKEINLFDYRHKMLLIQSSANCFCNAANQLIQATRIEPELATKYHQGFKKYQQAAEEYGQAFEAYLKENQKVGNDCKKKAIVAYSDAVRSNGFNAFCTSILDKIKDQHNITGAYEKNADEAFDQENKKEINYWIQAAEYLNESAMQWLPQAIDSILKSIDLNKTPSLAIFFQGKAFVEKEISEIYEELAVSMGDFVQPVSEYLNELPVKIFTKKNLENKKNNQEIKNILRIIEDNNIKFIGCKREVINLYNLMIKYHQEGITALEEGKKDEYKRFNEISETAHIIP